MNLTFGTIVTVSCASMSSVGGGESSTAREHTSELAQETELGPWITSPGALRPALRPQNLGFLHSYIERF